MTHKFEVETAHAKHMITADDFEIEDGLLMLERNKMRIYVFKNWDYIAVLESKP